MTETASFEFRNYRHQRRCFQCGLLKWLKGDASGAQDMRTAVQAVERAQTLTPQGSFWRAALAFFDALVAKPIGETGAATPLCVRIERQFGRLAEGASGVPEPLVREVLLGVAGDALAQAQDAWDAYAAEDDAPGLIAFLGASDALGAWAAELGNPDLAALAAELAGFSSWLYSHDSEMSEAIALEVATALLLLENALAGFDALGAEFAHQSRFVRQRLRACMTGSLLRTAPSIPLVDALSRRAQGELLASQAVAEIRTNLRSIKRVSDAILRDPARRLDAWALSGPLHQVKAALDILGRSRERQALAECERELARLAEPGAGTRPEEIERFAQRLSSLGSDIESDLARADARARGERSS